MSTYPVSDLSPALIDALTKVKAQFIERNPDYSEWFQHCCEQGDFAEQLARCWLVSEFAADFCCRQPVLFKQLVDDDLLVRRYQQGEHSKPLATAIAMIDSAEQLAVVLRQHRNQQMLRIIWRDINRLADLQETTFDISLLAENCIQQAMTFHHQQLADIYGEPHSCDSSAYQSTAIKQDIPQPQSMLVLGMGKLGAWELNLSSDIDLIFCYPHQGETIGAKKILSNSEFFTRLARKLIQSLDAMTADGFVFRVDMRLRPYGQSGALVLSFGSMEEYYQDQGRDWERYAMIKARVVAGDVEQGEQLMALLRSFTYRRYIDFSAIESLRSMKLMIQKETTRRGLGDDVKLGPGGIREIEFIAQCFQLIRGGRDLELQQRSVLKVLDILGKQNCLPQIAVEQLQQAYDFLRNTEHAIQAFRDQQTQALPVDDYPRALLAFAMGFADWELFYAALNQQRENVTYHFQQVIAGDEDDGDSAADQQWLDLWLGDEDWQLEKNAVAMLQQAGHENAEQVLACLNQLRADNQLLRMQTVGRDRLDQFMPLLLQAVLADEQPSSTFFAIFPLVESVLRRSAYLLLLVENPKALAQLVILCAGSQSIADELVRYPALLDELLDARTLYHVPEKNALRADLQQQMLRLPWDDLEAHMDALRYFKRSHQLHVSAAEVSEQLPLMKVSDYLTMIAEVILEHVLEMAWYNLVDKHGHPQKSPGEPCDKDFIVVGYGKLGGIELGHGSDLDLVFIHDAGPGLATDGERGIDNSMFFTRLGQRMIHILSAQTPSGKLYEVDMRLRPSGTSGLLVSSLEAFEAYQQKDAWTWEHQALVRARPVAGDGELAKRFEQLRVKLLCQPRDESALKDEVGAMRQKMRDHLLPKGLEQSEKPIFHLKHGTGAIVDIEFLVQYAVLAWSYQHPALAVFTDNIRILDALGNEGLFSSAEAEALTQAYKAYRAHTHRLNLQQQPNEVPMADFADHRQAVIDKWLALMG